MSTVTVARSFLALGFVIALPLSAQSPPANQTMGINPAAKNPTSTAGSQTTTTTTTTTTHARSMAHHRIHTVASGSSTGRESVWNDATRLAALLSDSQGKVAINAAAWKVVANEANTLANRLAARSSGNAVARKAATEARHHVREMRTAVMAGDAEGAKTHAGMALPFVYQLIDWSAPKAM